MPTVLKFFADESCDYAIVRGLRHFDFDVIAAVEDMAGAKDEEVLGIAYSQNRVLLTEDKDFGEWVFAHKSITAGVILIRYPSDRRTSMVRLMVELANEHGDALIGRFTVLEPGRARIRSI